jgi:hypothetical protein
LLNLHADVQEALHARKLSFADAQTLAPLPAEDQAAVLAEIQSAGKPLASRQVKAIVNTRRALAAAKRQSQATRLDGNFATLFDLDPPARSAADTFDSLPELNAVIGEMIAAAEGEDRIRGWARRLSRILEQLLKDK